MNAIACVTNFSLLMLLYFDFVGAFDRYLMHLGYEVKYVRNFTDIDDKVSSKTFLLFREVAYFYSTSYT